MGETKNAFTPLVIGSENSPPFKANTIIAPTIKTTFNIAIKVPPTDVILVIFSIPLVDINVTKIIHSTPSIPNV